jgi:hypothetical protein
MKCGNPGHSRSDLNKGNILKPTIDTLMEEGHKAFEAYTPILRSSSSRVAR